MNYLIRCIGGVWIANDRDRFPVLRDDGERYTVPAAALTTADCVAVRGRVLSVTRLRETAADFPIPVLIEDA